MIHSNKFGRKIFDFKSPSMPKSQHGHCLPTLLLTALIKCNILNMFSAKKAMLHNKYKPVLILMILFVVIHNIIVYSLNHDFNDFQFSLLKLYSVSAHTEGLTLRLAGRLL